MSLALSLSEVVKKIFQAIIVFILNRNIMTVPEVFCPVLDAPLSLVRVLIENEFRTVHSRKKDHSTSLCGIAVTLTLQIGIFNRT